MQNSKQSKCRWDAGQVKIFVRDATARWGAGWENLSSEGQRGVILGQAMRVMLVQAEENTYTSDDMRRLVNAMLDAAGVQP